MTQLATINPLAVAIAASFVAKNDVRYYLNGIYFEPHPEGGANIVATDGHKMLTIRDKTAILAKPLIVEFSPATVKACAAKNAQGLTLESTESEGGKVLARVATAGGSVTAFETVHDCRYPDWRSVMPDKLPEDSDRQAARLYLNACLVDGFAKACRMLTGKKTADLFLIQKAENVAVMICFPVHKSLSVRGVLMPLRIKDDVPLWEC